MNPPRLASDAVQVERLIQIIALLPDEAPFAIYKRPGDVVVLQISNGFEVAAAGLLPDRFDIWHEGDLLAEEQTALEAAEWKLDG